MWALVTDNTITKIINNPKGLVIDNIQYSRNIFSFRWSNEEREAIGIYEIVFNNTKKKDEAYYTNTNQTFTYDADEGTVTATYGDATAKAHADTTWTQEEIDALDDAGDLEAGDIKTRGLKYNLIRTVKKQAAQILRETDWYIVRKADADTNVPSAITTFRAAVRTKCAAMETAITNASDTPAIQTLYTYVNTADEGDPVVMERPLGEFPVLGS